MAKREYNGDPIDMTGLPGEQHITERNGETIDGTTEDDLGEEKLGSWPKALDEENFSNQQKEIISRLSMLDPIQDSKLANIIDCSGESVRQARHKASAYAHPSDLPFEAPDNPTKSIKIVQTTLSDDGEIPRKVNDNGRATDSEEMQDDSDELSRREKIANLYKKGLSTAEIAEKLGMEKNRVSGSIGSLVAQGVIESRSNTEETSKQPDIDDTSDTEEGGSTDTSGTDGVLIDLTVPKLVEIMEARGVSSETKEIILSQADF